MSHFIKTVEDLYEAMVNSVPTARFGIGFCEASQDRLVRVDGNDDELKKLAAENALAIGAGHSFLIIMKEAFPINVLPRIKECPEVCRIFCATANPVDVLLVETEQGRGIVGVVDGSSPVGIETEEDVTKRKSFLREIGYKR
jgi:adenosine/AMP kinase